MVQHRYKFRSELTATLAPLENNRLLAPAAWPQRRRHLNAISLRFLPSPALSCHGRRPSPTIGNPYLHRLAAFLSPHALTALCGPVTAAEKKVEIPTCAHLIRWNCSILVGGERQSRFRRCGVPYISNVPPLLPTKSSHYQNVD